MIRNRILLKSLAVFFVIEILVSTVLPTFSWALTAGPTAPEATSFEPVDTTDMVNLATGDFVYNIPILEVPGPSGGYPLSLSYHAGIMPNEEASWVGLGWTLNPGAITRTVNGFPDDQLGAVRTRVDYHSGGERTTFDVGVGYPCASFGLSVSNDSNLGIGVGAYADISADMGALKGVGLNLGASARSNPFGGGSNVSLTAGVNIGGISGGLYADKGGVGPTVGLAQKSSAVGGMIALQTNFQSVSVSAGHPSAMTGINMNSQGVKSASVAGGTFAQGNSNAGRWTTTSSGFTVPAPIGSGLFLNIGYNYLRYYSRESSNVQTIGTLHAKDAFNKNPDDWAFDSYALLDPDKSGPVKKQDPEKSRGGSFPAFDNYQVNAQGLSGSIQPYILENGNLFRQNLKKQGSTTEYEIKYEKTSRQFNSAVNFRFKNDFANTLGYSKNEMIDKSNQLSFENYSDGLTPEEGYNIPAKKLAGSKHTEWFRNREIREGLAKNIGFIDYQPAENRVASVELDEQIGGFMITNESGVTYHYALPVLESQEFSKSFFENKPNDIFQSNSSPQAYSYMWLLTAVTGPDFVDRNNNGLADNDDWGYWVSFQYGQWTSQYKWRNPVSGYHTDLDNDIRFYSRGAKHIYYLDAIKTRSHVAVFEKSVRFDGKGLVNNDTDPSFQPNLGMPGSIPTEVLRLKSIYLLNQKDYQELGGDGLKTNTQQNNDCNVLIPFEWGNVCRCKVFDDQDNFSQIKLKSLRVIDFNHGYELQQNTLNSFELTRPETLKGKLTLNGITFCGKSGVSFLPTMSFKYSKNPDYNKDAYDIWGFYKSDYTAHSNNNLARFVTPESAKHTDAWSLTSIKTSLGADVEIAYESDVYTRPVLYKSFLLNIDKITPQEEAGKLRITFHNSLQDLRSYIATGSTVSIMGVIRYAFDVNLGLLEFSGFSCDGAQIGNVGSQYKSIKLEDVVVSDVSSSYIEIYDESLYANMKLALGTYPIPTILPYPKLNPNTPCRNNSGQESNLNVTYNYAPSWEGGNLSFHNNISGKEGGGIRVRSVALSNINTKRITSYEYSSGTTSFEPFGLDVDILKTRQPKTVKDDPWTADIERRDKIVDEFLKNLQGSFSSLLSISREVASPAVIYKSVSVSEEVQHFDEGTPTKLPGKKVFEFEAFDERMVDRTGISDTENPYPDLCKSASGAIVSCFGEPDPIHGASAICWDQHGNPIDCGTPRSTTIRPLTLMDFSSWVGALKSITTFGPDGAVIEKSETHYLHENKTIDQFTEQLKTTFKNQGTITQIFHEYRVAPHDFGQTHYKIFSKKTEYPLVVVGQTSTNYKTGIKNSSSNLAFDFYTGAPTKVLSVDGYGNSFLSVTEPAYKVELYSGMTAQQISDQYVGMGLKVKNQKNKHMLTQAAKNYVYKVDPSAPLENNLGVLSASVQTWSDQIKVYGGVPEDKQPGNWRKQASYLWKGDDVNLNAEGLYPYSNFQIFDFSNPSNNSIQWQKNGEITLYDIHSNALEASDINNHHAATKMSADQTRVFATVANSRYNEFTFTGAEDILTPDGFYGGEVQKANGSEVFRQGEEDDITTHTGRKALQLSDNTHKAFQYIFTTEPNTGYHASVWVNSNVGRAYYSIDGGIAQVSAPPLESKKAGSWYLINLQIPTVAPNSVVEVWCATEGGFCNFDDFRICPSDAAMISYVYNEWGELSHILDNNNLYIHYKYDGMGRLKEVFKESFQYETVKVSETTYNYGRQD